MQPFTIPAPYAHSHDPKGLSTRCCRCGALISAYGLDLNVPEDRYAVFKCVPCSRDGELATNLPPEKPPDSKIVRLEIRRTAITVFKTNVRVPDGYDETDFKVAGQMLLQRLTETCFKPEPGSSPRFEVAMLPADPNAVPQYVASFSTTEFSPVDPRDALRERLITLEPCPSGNDPVYRIRITTDKSTRILWLSNGIYQFSVFPDTAFPFAATETAQKIVDEFLRNKIFGPDFDFTIEDCKLRF